MAARAEDLSTGLLALSALISSMREVDLNDLNEADTRHRFIDRLIHECLGWDRADTRVERRFNGEYSDYELGTPPQILIEAKRAGVYFELPSETGSQVVRSISSICKANSRFQTAFLQAQGYCNERGIQVGVVCTATQLVVFIAVRNDGVPPIEGKCLVFNGWEMLEGRFSSLWQAISPNAQERRVLLNDLASAAPRGLPPKLSTRIAGYPSFRYPSTSQQSLRTLSDLLIEDAPNTPDLQKRFYEECYCENGALAQESLVGKQILSARYASMFPPSAGSPVLQPLASQESFTQKSEVVAEALGRRPIVIIGDVGVGKTSFVRNLIYVKAKDELENAIFLYIDLGVGANLGQDLHGYMLEEIRRQLLDDHGVDIYEDSFVRGVYHGELLRFERGIYGRLKEESPSAFLLQQIEFLKTRTQDSASHLRQSLEHLASGRRKQIVLSIDNVDQRSPADQQSAFLASQEFAASWKALVLISLRPQTYFASKSLGSVSGYPQRILTISPPRVDLVLERRLTFSLDLAEGRLPLERLEGITIKLDAISLFLRALLNSLKKNREISELLTNITGGNIREVLDLIRGFIGSANVDSDKIIDLMRRTDRYLIPLHEFSKQALLGEYSHYDPKSSIAFNLFDVRYPDRREHFLALLLLGFLSSDSVAKTREGFLGTGDLVTELQGLSFVSDQIEHCLRRLTNKKLVETTERITFEQGLQGLVGDMPLAFRLTQIGAYHLQKWSASFSYIDAMIFDTPIFDDGVAQIVSHRMQSFDIRDRVDRANLFAEYLDATWREFDTPPVYFDWRRLRAAHSNSFDAVRRAAERLRRA